MFDTSFLFNLAGVYMNITLLLQKQFWSATWLGNKKNDWLLICKWQHC